MYYVRNTSVLLLFTFLGLPACETQPSEPAASVPASITVSPDVSVMAFGSSLQFSAVVLDQYGETMQNQPILWSTPPESPITIDPDGLAMAVASGVGTITATSASASASTTVTVDPLFFASISAGLHHTCALTTTGAGYCWGTGGSGQLGDGTTEDRSVPSPVSGGLTCISIDAGNSHTCGLSTEGEAFCWGTGTAGQLGNGPTGMQTSPVRVFGNHVFASISSSTQHTCGITTSGDGFCWGHGTYYKLGNESFSPQGDYSLSTNATGGW